MCTASSSAATPSRSCRTSSCAADEGSLRLKATDLDIEVTETIPADITEAGSTTVPAYMIYDIVRKLPDGAQVSLEMSRRHGPDADPLRPLALHAAGPAGERLPRSRRRRPAASLHAAGRRSQAPDREDAVRDLDRGDALLPQRHLSPHHRCGRLHRAARGRHRRPPPRPGRDRRRRTVRRACPA